MNLMSGYKMVINIYITQTGYIGSMDIVKNTTHCYSIYHGQNKTIKRLYIISTLRLIFKLLMPTGCMYQQV